jgi:hypothetical protein
VHRRPVRRFARSIAWLFVVTCSTAASATPDFPAAVVQDLGLPGITIDPPQGCTLCHATDAGGTSLKPFGQLLQQYGVKPYDEASLSQALSQLEVDEPALVEDIRAGRDPSSDTTSVHSPEYGCAVGRRGTGGDGRSALAAVAATLGAAAIRRRRRRRSASEPHLQ